MNHYGACVSYTTAWKYLKQLTQEARYLEVVREGHWQWVYDNLNYLLSIRHEREGRVGTHYYTYHNIDRTPTLWSAYLGGGGAWWQQKTSAKLPPSKSSCYTHMHMYMHVPN